MAGFSFVVGGFVLQDDNVAGQPVCGTAAAAAAAAAAAVTATASRSGYIESNSLEAL